MDFTLPDKDGKKTLLDFDKTMLQKLQDPESFFTFNIDS
jgi:hypothetical protein